MSSNSSPTAHWTREWYHLHRGKGRMREEGTGDEMTSEEWLATFRQALDDAVLMRTGRSIGDLASERVVADLAPMLRPLLEIAEAVAEDKRWQILPADDDRQYCMWCGIARSDPVHQGFCPVTKARALLGNDV